MRKESGRTAAKLVRKPFSSLQRKKGQFVTGVRGLHDNAVYPLRHSMCSAASAAGSTSDALAGFLFASAALLLSGMTSFCGEMMS